MCTDLAATPRQIIEWFVPRWNIEVTFEELRAHLGVETQRQWSDRAIARTTPSLFGIFSLVTLLATRLVADGALPVARAAWYHKDQATFSDVRACPKITVSISAASGRASSARRDASFKDLSVAAPRCAGPALARTLAHLILDRP